MVMKEAEAEPAARALSHTWCEADKERRARCVWRARLVASRPFPTMVVLATPTPSALAAVRAGATVLRAPLSPTDFFVPPAGGAAKRS